MTGAQRLFPGESGRAAGMSGLQHPGRPVFGRSVIATRRSFLEANAQDWALLTPRARLDQAAEERAALADFIDLFAKGSFSPEALNQLLFAAAVAGALWN